MDPVQELKETCEKIGKAFEEFKSENNRLIAKGVKDALAEAKLDGLNQAIDDLTGKREDLEKRIKAETTAREELERKVNRLRLGKTDEDLAAEGKELIQFNSEIKAIARMRSKPEPTEYSLDEYVAYKKAQQKYLRYGEKSLNADEQKAMLVGSDAEGGHFVTPDLSGRIATKVFELSNIRALASVQQIGSDALEGIEDRDESAGGWVGETATRSDTNTPQVFRYRIEANEMYAQPKASQKLLDDSSVDIESWLAFKVADKFARLEGAAFCTGDGVAKPRGFTTYTLATTGDSSRAWGTLQKVKTGANGDFAASAPADVLFDLIQAMKTAYLNGASWVTNRAVIGKIRKLKEATTNAYMWQPGLAQGQPDKLLGYTVNNAEDMPALATGSASLGFGNWKLGYQIVDRLGLRVLRDPYTDKPNVRFYTIKRTGGGVVNFEAIKVLTFET